MRNLDKLAIKVPAPTIAFVLNSLSEMKLHAVAEKISLLDLYSSLNLAIDPNHIVTAFDRFWNVDQDLEVDENRPELIKTMGATVNVLHCALVAHLFASNYNVETMRKYEGNLQAFKNDCLFSSYRTIKYALQGMHDGIYLSLGGIQEVQKVITAMSLNLCSPQSLQAFCAIRNDADQARHILDVSRTVTTWALELDKLYDMASSTRFE
jgi:hypothetical protein